MWQSSPYKDADNIWQLSLRRFSQIWFKSIYEVEKIRATFYTHCYTLKTPNIGGEKKLKKFKSSILTIGTLQNHFIFKILFFFFYYILQSKNTIWISGGCSPPSGDSHQTNKCRSSLAQKLVIQVQKYSNFVLLVAWTLYSC
jgi:hypothetical protein